MSIQISGTYQSRPVSLTVADGQIVDGRNTPAAAAALGAVAAQAEVGIPGIWSGPANLDDPVAVHALFSDLIDGATFEGDPLDLDDQDDPPGTVY
jgi:hypothetical protein